MPHPDPRETVLVLAAGKGARMGTPKALMTVDGRPWWRVQRERIAGTGASDLWVVSEAVETAIGADAMKPPIVRSDSEAPMFVSICAGLRALVEAPPRAVLVLPVDVPMCGGAARR